MWILYQNEFDLSVNILTNHGFNNEKIIVFGGNQLRPNLHSDYIDFVDLLSKVDSSKIQNEIFNVGYENLSILEIANRVKDVLEKKFNKSNIKLKLKNLMILGHII